MHIKVFQAHFICAELNQIAVHSTLLLNPCADTGDCTAASDYKHPGWRWPFPSVFCTVVWGRIGMGRGVVRPWRLTVTVTQASCLSISPASRCPLSSAPWLPDDNSSAFDQAARLSLYRQPRHWDCQDNEHKAMQQYSRSVSQARHIVRHESESQYDPVAPPSIVDQFCFVKDLRTTFVTVLIPQCAWLLCKCTGKERNQLSVSSYFYC